MTNTPAWFREIATYTAWPNMPNAHGPFGRDDITDEERRQRRGVPLFMNVQGARGIREARRLGGRALSYLSFMDTYVHTAGFENGTARAPWDPRRPQMLLLDREGHFVNTFMDSTWRMWRYYLCNNTRECVAAALKMVHQQMRTGADGIFVDNSGPRVPCYGHGLPVGYAEKYRGVVAAVPQWKSPKLVARLSPEELHHRGIRPGYEPGDPCIEALPKHRHIHPNRSHDYAYGQLLKRVRRVVRSYGADKVVVVNGNPSGCADGAMLESFIYSWAWKGPNATWRELKKKSAEWRDFTEHGGRLLALSYFRNTDRAPDECGLYSFAAAALLGYLWSDYGTLESGLGLRLRTLDLGKALMELRAAGAVEYRFFERGLVAINDEPRRRTAAVRTPPRFGCSRLKDLSDGSELKLDEDAWRLSLPARSGRVYTAGG